MDRYRFIGAIILSAVVLIGWQALMHRYNPPPPPSEPAVEMPEPQPSPANNSNQRPSTAATVKSPSTAPSRPTTQAEERNIVVSTKYWTITMSSRGAAATSWIIEREKRIDNTDPEIFAAGGGDLELVPPKEVTDKYGAPLGLRIPWAPELTDLVNSVNFDVDVDKGQSKIEIAPGTSKTINFVFSSPEASARKSFTFYGDRLIFESAVEVTQGGSPKQAMIVLGPRIGDQSDKQSGSYSTPPQVIVHTKAGKADRFPGTRITPSFAKIQAVNRETSEIDIDTPLAGDVESVELLNGDKELIGYYRVIDRDPSNRKLTLAAMPAAALKPGDRVAQGTDTLRQGYRWAGIVDHYFTMIAVPERPVDELILTNFQLKDPSDSSVINDYPSVAIPVGAGSVTRFFVGPKDRELLVRTGPELGADLDSLIDYGLFAIAIRPIIPIIGGALTWSASLFGNYGWGIALVTAIINLGLSPLRYYSSKKMKKAAKHQPRFKELQERMKELKANPKKHAKELEQLQREQLDLMKEANPLGGCLPLILQMPIFWAFFVYLTISLDVRHAPWIFWLKDLSTPDPYHILPIVMCVTMIGSTMLQPMPPSTDPSQKMQRLMMTWLMPIVLTWFFFFTAPSGLVLYWMVSNVVGVVIQLTINRMTTEPSKGPDAAKGVEADKTGKKGSSRDRGRFPEKRSSEA